MGYCYGGFAIERGYQPSRYQQQLSEVERLLISGIVQAKLKIVGYLAAAATTSVFQCYQFLRFRAWEYLVEAAAQADAHRAADGFEVRCSSVFFCLW